MHTILCLCGVDVFVFYVLAYDKPRQRYLVAFSSLSGRHVGSAASEKDRHKVSTQQGKNLSQPCLMLHERQSQYLC